MPDIRNFMRDRLLVVCELLYGADNTHLTFLHIISSHLTTPHYFHHSSQHSDQELRQSFVDMGYIRNVLMSVNPTVHNDPTAPSIETIAPSNGPSELEFRYVK